MELWQRLGDLHPKLVQFPLVLLLAGLSFDGIGLVRRDRRFHWAAAPLSGAGTVLLLAAFICGIYAEIWAGRAGVPQDPIEWHEFLANVASWGFVLLTAWRLLIGPDRPRQLATYVIAGLGFYALLGLTAYYGGQLVFQYGAAVVGGRANTALSLHDLNTLATRQTDENLRYSEMMHHIFGWLTLTLGGSLLATAAFPRRAGRVRWVGPALLLVGGVFLFFFADLDLYRLTDVRQLRDREVQLHKTIAVVLAVVGWMGLQRRTRAAAPVDDAVAVPAVDDPQPNPLPAYREREAIRSGSKPVAVMALIGGGLLFTHVHTVAPYANVAAGVYVAHMILGLTALAIGAARLLQDALPQYRRQLAVAFSVLMCVEAGLLITYNEGLPWYVGYGRYNRWGPHGGTVAPLGVGRAELTYDNVAKRLDVYLLDRFTAAPAPATAGPVDLLVARGYAEVGVPLAAVDGARSHFAADAPWLTDTATFSARITVPGGRAGFFDPWVAPVVVPVPPNEVARYQCPMHDGVLSERPGTCPACHMRLVPIQVGVRTVLHEAAYDLQMTAVPQPAPTASSADGDDARPDPLQRRLSFTPRRAGRPIRDLPVVHEHPMHLTIVSSDLTRFEHVHPVPQADGSLQLDYRFPAAGHYLVFAEYMPAGERDQVFRFPLAVGVDGGPPPPAELAPTVGTARAVAGHPEVTAELVCQPRTLLAGTHGMLLFRLADRGRPVTDLEPYMGAMGHCAIISQDTGAFLHCHPEQLYPPGPDARGGPDLAFHAVFPASGLYKVWGQFQRGGKVVVADFVVRVESSALPSRVVNFILNDG